jgi:hypothetical protein
MFTSTQLDRTKPGLAPEKVRLGTVTHDYSATTLFAALNVLDGTIISRNMRGHRHQVLAFGANWVRPPDGWGFLPRAPNPG